ncbi:MAG TPA: hypothetical protein VNK48_14555 [Xanthobacteraceae bacterium]|nr:hypothetical protein [Xanthobacteraceae bacterium]
MTQVRMTKLERALSHFEALSTEIRQVEDNLFRDLAGMQVATLRDRLQMMMYAAEAMERCAHRLRSYVAEHEVDDDPDGLPEGPPPIPGMRQRGAAETADGRPDYGADTQHTADQVRAMMDGIKKALNIGQPSEAR